MKSTIFAALAATAVKSVTGHALFQELWVDGVDMMSSQDLLPHCL